MNKLQKKNLANARRFQQKINKIVSRLLVIDIETASLTPPGEGYAINKFLPNKDLIRKLTMKEIEHILNMDAMKDEGYNEALVAALHEEYAERKLLLARIS